MTAPVLESVPCQEVGRILGSGKLTFTPTSSSWLNLVERWFAELTRKRLQRSAHRSIKDLTADLDSWVVAWNENPQPFIWHKTADQILESLKKYLVNL